MNKKQILMTSILIVLMLILVFSQKLFNNSFKEVALLDNNIDSLDEYQVINQGYVYSLPEGWSVKEKEGNSYVLYEAEFNDKDKNIIGYFQIIDTQEDIKSLAQNDINKVTLSHSKEKIENYKNSNWKGIRVEYKTNIKGGYSFINSIYYIGLKDNKVGKISFSIKERQYKDNMNAIFDTLVSSVKSE